MHHQQLGHWKVDTVHHVLLGATRARSLIPDLARQQTCCKVTSCPRVQKTESEVGSVVRSSPHWIPFDCAKGRNDRPMSPAHLVKDSRCAYSIERGHPSLKLKGDCPNWKIDLSFCRKSCSTSCFLRLLRFVAAFVFCMLPLLLIPNGVLLRGDKCLFSLALLFFFPSAFVFLASPPPWLSLWPAWRGSIHHSRFADRFCFSLAEAGMVCRPSWTCR